MNFTIEAIVVCMVLLAVIVTFTKNFQISSALLLSLVSGLALSYNKVQEYHAVIMLVCAVICLIDTSKEKLGVLPVEGNEINHAISYLYCLRVICALPFLMGIAGVEFSWLVSTAFY